MQSNLLSFIYHHHVTLKAHENKKSQTFFQLSIITENVTEVDSTVISDL